MRICELTGCIATRPVRLPFCSEHYCKLPKVIRRRLTRLRKAGQEYDMVKPSLQYLATVRMAHDWLTVNVLHKPIPNMGVLS